MYRLFFLCTLLEEIADNDDPSAHPKINPTTLQKIDKRVMNRPYAEGENEDGGVGGTEDSGASCMGSFLCSTYGMCAGFLTGPSGRRE